LFKRNITPKYPPKLIKIDVDGCEIDVLKGCSKIIDEHKPYFIFEYRLWLKKSRDPLVF
jgi:FkbM family methyltransferase